MKPYFLPIGIVLKKKRFLVHSFFLPLVFLILVLPSSRLFAQTHADCNDALLLLDSVAHPINFSGYGKVQEFTGDLSRDSIFIPQERQSFWLLIPIKKSGIFQFTIKADEKTDDWDFMLFKIHNYLNVCSKIQAKLLKPVRSNFANNEKTKNGTTGIKISANQKHVGAGIGNPFSQSLQVRKGDTLLLYTGNWSKSGKGYRFDYQIISLNDKHIPKPVFLSLKIYDKSTRLPVKANITIHNSLNSSILSLDNTSKITEKLKNGKMFSVLISANGYELKILHLNYSDGTDSIKKSLYIQHFRQGSTVNLPNIQFHPGLSTLLQKSIPYLKDLLHFLETNKNISIEVQGYVNGPDSPNIKYFRALSQARADAVKNYLIRNGIDENRITSKGYGNKNMIYPNPQTDAQNEANRRVEIKIDKIN